MVPDWEGPEPSEDSTGSGGANGSGLEWTTLVSDSPGAVVGLPSTVPSTARSVPEDINDCCTGLNNPN